MCIELRGRDRLVTEEALNESDVDTSLHQGRRGGMPKHMRRYATRYAGFFGEGLEAVADAGRTGWTAAGIDQQPIRRLFRLMLRRDILTNQSDDAVIREKDLSLPAAFSEYSDRSLVEIDVLDTNGGEFADPHAGREQ